MNYNFKFDNKLFLWILNRWLPWSMYKLCKEIEYFFSCLKFLGGHGHLHTWLYVSLSVCVLYIFGFEDICLCKNIFCITFFFGEERRGRWWKMFWGNPPPQKKNKKIKTFDYKILEIARKLGENVFGFFTLTKMGSQENYVFKNEEEENVDKNCWNVV